MTRFQELAYVHRHRKMVQKLVKEKGYSFPFHDLHNGDIKNKVEAAFDWESARFTNPDKPLDAYDTWKKYYFMVDMESILRLLGLYRGE